MTPLDCFQRIYIINLPDRADRRQEMNRQLQSIGMSLRSPNIHIFPAIRPESQEEFPSIGAHGAFRSHLGVLKDAVERKLDRILIFEDDLNFIPGFAGQMAPVAAELERLDWSFFYGGYVLASPLDAQTEGAVVTADPALPIQTAHFLAAQGPVIAETVAYLETILTRKGGDPRGGPMHVDGAYSHFRQANPHRLTLLATPELGYQRSSRSDIYNLRWFDRAPIVRQAVSALRQIKNRVRG